MAANLGDGAPWTATAVADLIHMVRVERLSNWQIAERTGRGVTAIYTAVSRYAVRTTSTDAKERVCMPCQKPFMSEHRGNRICGMCLKNLHLECA